MVTCKKRDFIYKNAIMFYYCYQVTLVVYQNAKDFHVKDRINVELLLKFWRLIQISYEEITL